MLNLSLGSHGGTEPSASSVSPMFSEQPSLLQLRGTRVHKPKSVSFYGGENDSQVVQAICADVCTFVKIIRMKLYTQVL